jgi:hypothetical protein
MNGVDGNDNPVEGLLGWDTGDDSESISGKPDRLTVLECILTCQDKYE